MLVDLRSEGFEPSSGTAMLDTDGTSNLYPDQTELVAARAGGLPPLRRDVGDVESRDPLSAYPHVGPYTIRLFTDARKSEVNPGGIADGKVLSDSPPVGGYEELERRAAEGYARGANPNHIFRSAVERVVTYENVGGVMEFPEGTSAYAAALKLREHQEHTVSDGRRTYIVRHSSDGRFRREDVYPHDVWGIIKGYNATGDIGKIVDVADILARESLRKGYPSNGVIVDEKGDTPNYFDGRTQRPSLFYIIRVLGEHYGDEAYTHPPYLRAMERLWEHFNPAPDLLATQNRGSFHAYQRGGVTPEGWPFSIWGDDTNNGKRYEDYLPRLECVKEDLETAELAAKRAAPADRARVRAETYVHIAAAAGSGRDFDQDRWADGKDLSYINTTNIIPLDLQCEMADAAEVLSYAWSAVRRQAEARGDFQTAKQAYIKELYYADNREARFKFIRKYGIDPQTGVPHDVELLNPTASYDSLRTYSGFRRTPIISSTNTMAPIYSGALDLRLTMAAKRAAERELLDRGGLASTNSRRRDRGQWAGDEAWMIDQREAACATAHGSARFMDESPDDAEELIEFGEKIQTRAINAVQRRLDLTHTFPEHWNARDPDEVPAASEYPHQPNLAMTAEGTVELIHTNLRQKAAKLAPSAGRFVVARS